MSIFKEMTLFFGYSAKRKEILKTHLGKETESSNFLADNVENEQEYISNNAAHRRTLPTLSDTRWLARVDSISTLLVNYKEILNALID